MTSSPNLPASIGEARMKADGTLELMLRAEGPGGMVGDAFIVYPPAHPNYAEVKKHLEAVHGALQVDVPVSVPPWPDA
jgi:hypothetical protein